MNTNLIKVIKNGKWTFIENTLEAFQEAVGGFIETITIFEGIVMVVDEEGVLKGKKPSCTLLNYPIVGDWLLVGAQDSDFTDLKEKDWKTMRGLGVIKPAKAV